MKHILILASWYSEQGPEGSFIRDFGAMCAARGYRTGLCYVGNAQLWTAPRIALFPNPAGFDIGILRGWHPPKVPGLITLWKKRYATLYREYCHAYGTPDLLHAHGYLAGIAAQYLCERYTIPYCITEHSSALSVHAAPWYHRNAIRNAYATASLLIAVSNSLRQAMQQYGTPSQRIAVVGNVIDVKKYPLRAHRLQDPVQLVSVGALEPRKNYPLLLHALEKLSAIKSFQLTLIGTGPEERMLRQLASKLQIADRVRFEGYLPASAYLQTLAESDIFLSTSTYENFGVAIAEALVCGLPVVATRSGGPEEYLNETTGELVPGDDPAALAKAINSVIELHDAYVPASIRAYAESLFDASVIGAHVDALYAGILTTEIT